MDRTDAWQPDVLGKPYYAETIELPDDDEGAVVATLVGRRGRSRSTKAVLHVHGFADYFFQTPVADYWVSRGYDFYALDLRKYGRSLRPHQTPNFTTDLASYYAELDEATAMARSLADGPTFGHAMTKTMLWQEWSSGLGECIEAEAQAQAICMQTKDFERAYHAFVAKQKPAFEGN